MPVLAAAVAESLVRDVSQDLAPGPAAARERVARVAWSCLAEPGDGVAGAVIETVGAERSLDVVARGGTAADLLAAAEGEGTRPSLADVGVGLERWRPRLQNGAVERAFRQGARFAARLVVPGDPCWPEGLDDLGPHRPVVLWVRGRVELLGGLGRSIALIGARAATGYGEHVAVEASAGLVDRGVAIVSGAAYGIDGAAHRAALASGGDTVAVLAGGLDRFYPSGHEGLLTRIVERGAVVAEVPCGTAPTRWRFLQRNRIIAAASAATVVVEAGWRSGSLNTAGHAAALGRPLGAVPGPVTSSASAGCHRLLREYGAVCVTTPDEMAELVPGLVAVDAGDADGRDRLRPTRDPEGTRVRVLDALSARSARTVDRIAADSGLPPERVRAELGVLELEGRARTGFEGWTKVLHGRGGG
ncbi:MAG: DNA-protecting protein DprA [Micrococcales bacterium]|nr:DNA-protecting protein DprA [Micrococcales bacterium]